MADVTIKTHSRKSKTGKTVTIKSYTRRVGRKGVKSNKIASGEEIAVKKKKYKNPYPNIPFEITNLREEEPIKVTTKKLEYTGPPMTKKESAEWDAKARKDSNTSVAYREQLKKRKSSASNHIKKRNVFAELENKIAKFAEKYSGKKYKKSFK